MAYFHLFLAVSEVERRSRSLRTQYGRVLWHPERVSSTQQEMLREKLAFLRPFIVRRRGDSHVGGKFEDKEELETDGSTEQEMGSSFGSPLDADVTDQDLDDGPPCVASTSAPLHRPHPQPRVTDVVSLSCPHHHGNEASADQPEQTTNTSEGDLLNQFAQVMLADMRHIKDPVVLMRLRRDITDLVFKAVEEDQKRRCVRVPSTPRLVQSVQSRSCSRLPQVSSQTDYGRRTRSLKSKWTRRWEDVKHMRRMSRSQVLMQPIPQGQTPEEMNESSSQVIFQPSEIKEETERHIVKIEEETLPSA
uniref:uncharacterized protein LOC124067672 isoform X2 n=1 Tax=Scatophagus argus TaxID=75038 RepID=UPI001ED7EF25|nr:uncharacterized protein LOC124067672 isoform X2 [Scatophagus argus]